MARTVDRKKLAEWQRWFARHRTSGLTVAEFCRREGIEAGRWKAQNGRVCVAFRTTDGVGPYHSAACLDGDRIEGQTWAEHREFVFVWNAARGEPAT